MASKRRNDVYGRRSGTIGLCSHTEWSHSNDRCHRFTIKSNDFISFILCWRGDRSKYTTSEYYSNNRLKIVTMAILYADNCIQRNCNKIHKNLTETFFYSLPFCVVSRHTQTETPTHHNDAIIPNWMRCSCDCWTHSLDGAAFDTRRAYTFAATFFLFSFYMLLLLFRAFYRIFGCVLRHETVSGPEK